MLISGIVLLAFLKNFTSFFERNIFVILYGISIAIIVAADFIFIIAIF